MPGTVPRPGVHSVTAVDGPVVVRTTESPANSPAVTLPVMVVLPETTWSVRLHTGDHHNWSWPDQGKWIEYPAGSVRVSLRWRNRWAQCSDVHLVAVRMYPPGSVLL